jgi:hypothetical protein
VGGRGNWRFRRTPLNQVKRLPHQTEYLLCQHIGHGYQTTLAQYTVHLIIAMDGSHVDTRLIQAMGISKAFIAQWIMRYGEHQSRCDTR